MVLQEQSVQYRACMVCQSIQCVQYRVCMVCLSIQCTVQSVYGVSVRVCSVYSTACV